MVDETEGMALLRECEELIWLLEKVRALLAMEG